MDLGILDVTIFVGHTIHNENRVSIRNGIVTEIGPVRQLRPPKTRSSPRHVLHLARFVDAPVQNRADVRSELTIAAGRIVHQTHPRGTR